MLSVVINMKIMKWYTMYICFVDLGVVVYVDTEWVIWDFDTKMRNCCLCWHWMSDLRFWYKNEESLDLGLGLDKKFLVLTTVLFTSLAFRAGKSHLVVTFLTIFVQCTFPCFGWPEFSRTNRSLSFPVAVHIKTTVLVVVVVVVVLSITELAVCVVCISLGL